MTTPNKPTVSIRVEKFVNDTAFVEWIITDESGKQAKHNTTCLATEIAETMTRILSRINPDHDGGFYAQRLAKQIHKGARTSACTLYLSNPKEEKAS